MQKEQLLITSPLSFFATSIQFKDIIDFALTNKHTHVICVDQQYINSFAFLYCEAKKHDLTPICALKFFYKNSEFLLIAKNFNGYKQLIKISNQQEIKEEFLSDVIVIHLDGEILFENHNDFYIANSFEKNGVYIRENKFKEKEDYQLFCLLCSIKNQTTLEDEEILNSQYVDDFLLQPDVEKNENWNKNLKKIISDCEKYEISETEDTLNFFDKSDEDIYQQLKNKAEKNLEEYQQQKNINLEVYKNRLLYELSIIKEQRYLSYFLIVDDFIFWAKQQNILIGPGRGSVCGSLLAFLLNITEIDPLIYGLYFERFLNKKRKEWPDIDVDVDSSKKKLILNYLVNKYGKNNVFFLSVLQNFKFKSALKTSAESLKINEKKVDFVLKKLRNNTEEKYSEIISELQKNNIFDSEIDEWINLSKKLLFFPKNYAIHPAGIIIAKNNLPEKVPITKSTTEELDVIKYGQKELAEMGYIKFDLLSLNYLELIAKCINLISEKINRNFCWSEIDTNDAKVFWLFANKYTQGIFQFEGKLINEISSTYKPTSIHELANIIALIRPGAQEESWNFVINKHNIKSQINKKLIDIVSYTSGIVIYQEQIMEIVARITGGSFEDADLFRKAITKKNKNIFDTLAKKFKEQGLKNGFTEEEIQDIWNLIYKFAGYGFNKSHAVAYSLISYRLAWLKQKYSQEFFVSLLEIFGPKDEYFSEIFLLKYSISFPNIHHYLPTYSFVDQTLYISTTRLIHEYYCVVEKVKKIINNIVFNDLLECLLFLINGKISKDEILKLNEIAFFNVLFKKNENQNFIVCNIEKIYKQSLFCIDEKKILFLRENLIFVDDDFSWNAKLERAYNLKTFDDFIKPDVFQKYNAKSLLLLNKQINSVEKYLGFISSWKKIKTKKNKDALVLNINSCNYSFHEICFFSDKSEKLLNLSGKHMYIFSISKNRDVKYINDMTKINE